MAPPTSLQLFLSSRPPRTTTFKEDGTLTAFGGEVFVKFYEEDGYNWTEAHIKPPQAGKPVLGGAPLHLHITQNETFQVLQGSMSATMSGKKLVLKAGDPDYTSPMGEWHSFDPVLKVGDTEDFKMRLRVDPEDVTGFDEKFFRNFQSYLSDCELHKTSPSLFQIIVFFNSAEILLGLPVPMVLLKPLHSLLGYIGIWLGYRADYEEYTGVGKKGI